MKYHIQRISDCPELLEPAARWFHEKWDVPEKAYRESMEASLSGAAVPRWYIALEGGRIIGGMGVIDNDFHERKDLRPNVCAVYTEPDYRGRGVAGALLEFVCADMQEAGIEKLYLLTDHTSLYERWGWEFFGMVRGDGGKLRMYIHRTSGAPDIRPGRYRHYKGRDYQVLFLARHSETEELLVIYQALYGDRGIWARPASMWNELVNVDGRQLRRFTYIGE